MYTRPPHAQGKKFITKIAIFHEMFLTVWVKNMSSFSASHCTMLDLPQVLLWYNDPIALCRLPNVIGIVQESTSLQKTIWFLRMMRHFPLHHKLEGGQL